MRAAGGCAAFLLLACVAFLGAWGAGTAAVRLGPWAGALAVVAYAGAFHWVANRLAAGFSRATGKEEP